METALHISFPTETISWKTYYQLPDKCLYKVPFASPTLLSGPKGDLLSQSYNGGDYWIELLSCSIRTGTTIDIRLTKSIISFALLLQGRLDSELLPGNFARLLKGTYAAFYLPHGKSTISLAHGEYTLLHIIPPAYYLQSMSLEHPEVQDMLNHFEHNSLFPYKTAQFQFPQAILRIIKSMERCNKKGAALDLVLRSYILKLLSFYNHQLKEKQEIKSFQSNHERALAVKEYILSNLGNIQLGRMKELTQQFNITPKTLTREFKKIFNKTVPDFIRDERLNKAHQILSGSDKQVQEAAVEVGYDYLSHFSREFKNKFGYAPGTIKKKKANSNDLE